MKADAKVYSFEELSDKAKRRALEDHSDCNVNYDWWEWTYDDAEKIGLEITGFDLDRSMSVKGDLTMQVADSCEKILANHGEGCDTYQLALEYKNLCAA